MADYDLTQTDAQVQSILNDAQDAMGAGAQTSLITDYIMLKGTNGRYHKILKDSFTEAVRNTLAGLLVNNDKGTTISQIAAIASGDFGSVTPANLASVLGGLVNIGLLPFKMSSDMETDFNNYTYSGIYRFNTYSSPMQNPPESNNTVGLCIVINWNNASNCICQQIAISTRRSKIYIREDRTDSGWTVWNSVTLA